MNNVTGEAVVEDGPVTENPALENPVIGNWAVSSDGSYFEFADNEFKWFMSRDNLDDNYVWATYTFSPGALRYSGFDYGEEGSELFTITITFLGHRVDGDVIEEETMSAFTVQRLDSPDSLFVFNHLTGFTFSMDRVTESGQRPTLQESNELEGLVGMDERLLGIWETVSGVPLWFFCSPTVIEFFSDGWVHESCCDKYAKLLFHGDGSFTLIGVSGHEDTGGIVEGPFEFTYLFLDNQLILIDQDGDSATYSRVMQ